MGAIAFQITSLTIVFSTVYSDADQRKHKGSASLAFVQRIHRGSVNSPHKWPVTRRMFPYDDVIKFKFIYDTISKHQKIHKPLFFQMWKYATKIIPGITCYVTAILTTGVHIIGSVTNEYLQSHNNELQFLSEYCACRVRYSNVISALKDKCVQGTMHTRYRWLSARLQYLHC